MVSNQPKKPEDLQGEIVWDGVDTFKVKHEPSNN